MKPPYTSRQGQFLAFIHHYTALHGCPPAEAEMGQFFQITPPTVHQMILTLERRGLIIRAPGRARSIKLTLSPEKLPPLPDLSASKGAPLPVRQSCCKQPTGTEAILLQLGKAQIEDLFAYYDQNSLDDSEFIPLLDTLIESFARAGLSEVQVKKMRRNACELYHRCCQDTEPESTMESNLELMASSLPGPRRTTWTRLI